MIDQWTSLASSLGAGRRRPHRRQPDDGADREVDAAGGDHERHADRYHADHRREPQDRQQVVGAGEPVPRADEADDAQQDKGDHQPQVAGDAGRQGAAGPITGDRRRDVRRHGPGGLMDVGRRVAQPGALGALVRHAAVPPITRSRTWFSLIPAAGPSCSTRPPATTSTRSARPSTSSTSLDTTTTATPESASSLMST